MLTELSIENLAVIGSARLELVPGLNVITGETGAGKTILAHAITLLLGTRVDNGLIRPGAAEASVEAVFSMPPGFFSTVADSIDVPEDGQLIVRRRLSPDGPSRSYAGGHAVNSGVLGQLTGRCLRFSGQHEQRRLMLASNQLDMLDRFGGQELIDLREEFRLLFQRRVELASGLDNFAKDADAAAQEAELIKFQLIEIEAAAPVPGEDESLEAKRRRLVKARELEEAANQLAGILGAAPEETGVMEALAGAMARLEAAAGVDAELDNLLARLRAGFFELEETGRDARHYAESVELDPAALSAVEERLEVLAGLKRKYGGAIEKVLAYAAGCRERLSRISALQADHSSLEQDLRETGKEAVTLALKLRRLRQAAAARLEREATNHLRELDFPKSRLKVEFSFLEGGGKLTPAVLSSAGAEKAEFFADINPGMPPAPIRKAASGGELSRIMLAIKSAAPVAEAGTIVFDEIDAGIGGKTGLAVGAQLKKLARSSQIVCITHLPQIACFAEAHFVVSKTTTGFKTVTEVARLPEDEVIDELCRMMGSQPSNKKARAHAAELARKAAEN